MNRKLALVTVLLLSVSLGGEAFAKAAQCRDAKGKFMKCATPAAAAAPVKCRDAKGKFAKCGAPGAVAVTAKTK